MLRIYDEWTGDFKSFMRILFYASSFVPKCDGISYRLKTLIDYWANDEDQFYLMTPNSLIVDQYPRIEKVIKVPGDNMISKKLYPDISHTSLFSLGQTYKLVKSAIEQYEIDIVHVLGPEAIGFFFRYINKPAILSYHTDLCSYSQKLPFLKRLFTQSFIVSGVLKFTVRVGYSKILSPSQSFLDRMVNQKLVRREDRRLGILPTTLDSSLFYLKEEIERNQNTLIFAGRIAPEKNLKLLFEAMRLMKGKKLIIAGEGSYLTKCREWASQDVNNKYLFLGKVKRENLVDYYNESSFFVNPSETETFGFTTIEAIGCGAVPLVYPEGGSLDIVRDRENGCFIRTAQDIADRIEEVNHNEEFYQKLLEEGKKTFEEYDIKKCVKEIRQLYLNTLKNAE